MNIFQRGSVGCRAVMMAVALVGASCACEGCGGGPGDGSRVQESQEVAARRKAGIGEAMKSGAYGPQAKKAIGTKK
jgi:hypothetical protein